MVYSGESVLATEEWRRRGARDAHFDQAVVDTVQHVEDQASTAARPKGSLDTTLAVDITCRLQRTVSYSTWKVWNSDRSVTERSATAAIRF